MGLVLLRVGREDSLVLDPQAEPPDVELGEPVEPGRGKGHPVVRADRLGNPYSRNSRSKTGRTPTPLVESNPWQARR
jgi:hypothetical protein